MAKRTPKSSRAAGAGTTTTNTVEPSALPDAVPLSELETPVAAVAVAATAFEPPATDVAAPLTALDPPPPSPPAALAGGTLDVDRTMGQLTRLYRAITGRDVPLSSTPYAPIPANKAPAQHVEEQLDRLLDVLASTRTLLLRLAR